MLTVPRLRLAKLICRWLDHRWFDLDERTIACSRCGERYDGP